MSRVFVGDYDACVYGACDKKLRVYYIRRFDSFTYAHVNSVDDAESSHYSLLQENRTQSGETSEKIEKIPKFGISKNSKQFRMEAVCQFNSLGLSPSIRGTNA